MVNWSAREKNEDWIKMQKHFTIWLGTWEISIKGDICLFDC